MTFDDAKSQFVARGVTVLTRFLDEGEITTLRWVCDHVFDQVIAENTAGSIAVSLRPFGRTG